MKRIMVFLVGLAMLLVATPVQAQVLGNFSANDASGGQYWSQALFSNGVYTLQAHLQTGGAKATSATLWYTKDSSTTINVFADIVATCGANPSDTIITGNSASEGFSGLAVTSGWATNQLVIDEGDPDQVPIVPPTIWTTAVGRVGFSSYDTSVTQSVNTILTGSVLDFETKWSLTFGSATELSNFKNGLDAVGVVQAGSFSEALSASIQQTPEPSSLGILAISTIGFLTRRRRQAS